MLTTQRLGAFVIIERLGEGGMGTVYLALDTNLKRRVALKVLRSDLSNRPDLVERFLREAEALGRLHHPNVATLFSLFEDNGRYVMVMEFVPGVTLEDHLRRHGPLAWPAAVRYLVLALQGIQHAHGQGVIHRDIKPANLMLDAETGGMKVTDFGIAHVLGNDGLTRPGQAAGTLQYMAPERIESGISDVRTDIYSLGIVLYQMLSGRLPFEASSDYGLMRAHLETPAPALGVTGVPFWLEALIQQCLEKRPEARPQTVAALIAALNCQDLAADELPSSPPPTRFTVPAPAAAPPPAARPGTAAAVQWLGQFQRAQPLHIAAAVFVVLMLALVLFALLRPREPEPEPFIPPRVHNVRPTGTGDGAPPAHANGPVDAAPVNVTPAPVVTAPPAGVTVVPVKPAPKPAPVPVVEAPKPVPVVVESTKPKPAPPVVEHPKPAPAAPADADLLKQARDAHQRGDLAQAAQLAEQAAALRPNGTQAYLLLSQIHLRGGRTPQAVTAMRHALQHGAAYRFRAIHNHAPLGDCEGVAVVTATQFEYRAGDGKHELVARLAGLENLRAERVDGKPGFAFKFGKGWKFAVDTVDRDFVLGLLRP